MFRKSHRRPFELCSACSIVFAIFFLFSCVARRANEGLVTATPPNDGHCREALESHGYDFATQEEMIRFVSKHPESVFLNEMEKNQGKKDSETNTPMLCFANEWLLKSISHLDETLESNWISLQSRLSAGVEIQRRGMSDSALAVELEQFNKNSLQFQKSPTELLGLNIREESEKKLKEWPEFTRQYGSQSELISNIREAAQARRRLRVFPYRKTMADIEKFLKIVSFSQSMKSGMTDIAGFVAKGYPNLPSRFFPRGITLPVVDDPLLDIDFFLNTLPYVIAPVGISLKFFGVEQGTEKVDGRIMNAYEFYEHDVEHERYFRNSSVFTFLDHSAKSALPQETVLQNMRERTEFLEWIRNSHNDKSDSSVSQELWDLFLFFVFHDVRISYENSAGYRVFRTTPSGAKIVEALNGLHSRSFSQNESGQYEYALHLLPWYYEGLRISSVKEKNDTVDRRDSFYPPLDPDFLIENLDFLFAKGAERVPSVDGYRVDYVPWFFAKVRLILDREILRKSCNSKTFLKVAPVLSKISTDHFTLRGLLC